MLRISTDHFVDVNKSIKLTPNDPSHCSVVMARDNGVMTLVWKIDMIELAKRKRTTKEGVAQLATLIAKLQENMVDDIQNFMTKKQIAVSIPDNNGLYTTDCNYSSWVNDTAFFVYKSGKIVLVSERSHVQGATLSTPPEDMNGNVVRKIDFAQAVAALEELCEVYNARCKAKDVEIERFLLICKEFGV